MTVDTFHRESIHKTENESAAPSKQQVAHDMAMAYINNRYAAEVTGDFEVSTLDDDTTGSGSVWTTNLPHVNKRREISVGTGQRYFFG